LSEPRRNLFVISRDLAEDQSAQYLLRRALATCRRGADVTVVLRDRATSCLDRAEEIPLVARLLTSGAEVFVQPSGLPSDGSPGVVVESGVTIMTLRDEELAAMLVDATVEAHWC
jgi:hypothetical protein